VARRLIRPPREKTIRRCELVILPHHRGPRDDRCERRVSEFIGRETIDPFGKIVGGYIDACNVMLFEIELADGDVIDTEPRTTVIFRRCATGGET